MPEKQDDRKKYKRRIQSAMPEDLSTVWVDVYCVLKAFGVTCPARQHAIKKLLAAGQRDKGSELNDLEGALIAVERAIQLKKNEVPLD